MTTSPADERGTSLDEPDDGEPDVGYPGEPDTDVVGNAEQRRNGLGETSGEPEKTAEPASTVTVTTEEDLDFWDDWDAESTKAAAVEREAVDADVGIERLPAATAAPESQSEREGARAASLRAEPGDDDVEPELITAFDDGIDSSVADDEEPKAEAEAEPEAEPEQDDRPRRRLAVAEPEPDAGPLEQDTEPPKRHIASETTLDDVLTAARTYLDVTPQETGYLIVALGVAVAKVLEDEEPLWLILAGSSGGGKTEAIRLLKLVADKQVDELTRAGLLSWATVGKKARRTGLLTQIPSVALVTISDFSTVVTMGDREARARMFGMLRVIYDGRVYRSIGGQPATENEARRGDTLEWEGHLTLLAGATHAIDTHLSFEAALGERWLVYRLAESDAARGRRRAAFSIDRARVPELRQNAQELAATLVEHARRHIPTDLSLAAKDVILDAATFCAHARTGVQFEGIGRHRVPIGYPSHEEPMRLAGQLYRLARCLVGLGLDEQQAAGFAVRAARDSVPLARFRALREVADSELATVASVHRAIGRGDRWGAKWELTALRAIGMVEVEGPDEADDPKATRVYSLAPEYRQVYESVGSLFSPLSLREEVERER